MPFSVVVVCAGTGSRFGVKKQFCLIDDIPLFFHSYLAFQKLGAEEMILVIDSSDRTTYEDHFSRLKNTQKMDMPFRFEDGGAERYLSVWNGVQECSSEFVLIHDAARPIVRLNDLKKIITTLFDGKHGVVLMQPMTDTIKRVDSKTGIILENLPRHELAAVSTPQGFPTKPLKMAFEKLLTQLEKSTDDETVYIPTDDVEVYQQAGHQVQGVIAEFPNPKITYQPDLEMVSNLYFKYEIAKERT